MSTYTSTQSSSPVRRNGSGIDRRRFIRSALLATGATLAGGVSPAVASAASTASAASDGVTLRLPAPTGPHPIGVTDLYLVDRSRRDPWDASIPVRELMVSVFYPAAAVRRGFPLAPQMLPGAAEVFGLLEPYQHPQLPASGVDWAATMTHSRLGALARPGGPYPVALYSPGAGDPRTLGMSLAEELASHGWIVVAIDHPGDAVAVEFPTATGYRGVVRETVFRADPWTDPQLFDTMIATRLADTAFVLDQVDVLAAGGNPDALNRPLPQGLGRALDPGRIAMYGHSAGGTTAAESLYRDCRIRTAANLEGYLEYPPDPSGQPGSLFPVARHGTDRPLLLLGTDGFRDADIVRSWTAVVDHSGGRAHWHQIDHAMHWVFTDYAAFAPQLQTAGLLTEAGRVELVGAISPTFSIPLVRDSVRSFLIATLSYGGSFASPVHPA